MRKGAHTVQHAVCPHLASMLTKPSLGLSSQSYLLMSLLQMKVILVKGLDVFYKGTVCVSVCVAVVMVARACMIMYASKQQVAPQLDCPAL